jgi:hypothetical protein
MGRVITVTWAPEAIDGALERATAALRYVDEAHPEVARLSIVDLACLIDLGRHALAQHEKTERAIDHCRESIAGWQADEDACSGEAASAITDLTYVIELLS